MNVIFWGATAPKLPFFIFVNLRLLPVLFHSLSTVTAHPLPVPITFTSINDQAFTPPSANRGRKNAITAETLELRAASAAKKKSERALEKALKKSTKSLI